MFLKRRNIDKVGDQYAVGAYLTTRAEQEAIIARAQAEKENAEAYCKRTFQDPQDKAIAKAQETLRQMDLVDQFGTTNIDSFVPSVNTDDVNWSVDELYQ